MTLTSIQTVYPRYYDHPASSAAGLKDVVFALSLPRQKQEKLLVASREYVVEREGEPPRVRVTTLPLPTAKSLGSSLFDSEDDLISHGFVLRGSA